MPRGSLTTNLAKTVSHRASETLSYKIENNRRRQSNINLWPMPSHRHTHITHTYTPYTKKKKRKEGGKDWGEKGRKKRKG